MAEKNEGLKSYATGTISSIIAAPITSYFNTSILICIGISFLIFVFYVYAFIINIRQENIDNLGYMSKISNSISKLFIIASLVLCLVKILAETDAKIGFSHWQEFVIIFAPILLASAISPLIIYYLKKKSPKVFSSIITSDIQGLLSKTLKENQDSLKKIVGDGIEEIQKGLNKQTTILCPMAAEVEGLKKTTTFAVTGTCIPFMFYKEKSKIETCLICNPNYEPVEWMFPGGHAFKTGDTEQFVDPAEVAENRTLEEADLRVHIIDTNNGVDLEVLDEESEFSANASIHERVFVKRVPHFTYLFKLNDRVECYKEKGHLYHYDCVYIGEYKKKGAESKRKRLYIQLPVDCENAKSVKDIVQNAMMKHARSINQTVSPSNIDYVSLMLASAFFKYKQVKFDGTK